MFFADKKNVQDSISMIPIRLKKKSKFDPSIHSPTLNIFQQVVTNEVMKQWNTGRRNIRNNLSQQERQALKQLSGDSTIITKKADKGGGMYLRIT